MSADFTTIPAVKAMVAELQAVPQSTIPIPDRKHIIERIKACLVDRADAFRDAEFKDLRRPADFHDRITGGCIATCNYYVHALTSHLASHHASVIDWCVQLANIDRLAADQECKNPPAPGPGSLSTLALFETGCFIYS